MTNIELARKVKDIATKYKTLYVMGCFGSPMTEANKKRFCENHSYNRQATRQKMIKSATADTFGFDCVCLIKGVLWGWNGDKTKTHGGAKYNSNDVPDIGADVMITKCKNVSSDFSKIEVGEVVWCKGHIGVYIGNGLAVECTPSWANKVQITACNCSKTGYKRRNWTKHGKLPYIEYIEETIKKTDSFFPARGYFKKGDSGKEIHKICVFFANGYYSYFGNTKKSAKLKLLGEKGDGDYFGENLYAWTKEFQKRSGLKVDGYFGPLTLKELEKHGFKK
jgi:hypothetical protein